MAGSVPKFSSFRPKQASTLSLPSAIESSQTKSSREGQDKLNRDKSDRRGDRHRERSRHQGSSEDVTEHHWQRHQQRGHHVRYDTTRSQPAVQDLVPAEESNYDSENTLYVSDRKGDSKNLAYGSLHRYSVPQYRRTGYGQIVGLDEKVKIDRERSTLGEVYVLASSRKVLAKSDTGVLRYQRPEKERKVRFIKPTSAEHAFDTTNGVIQFSKGRKRKRGSESPRERGQRDVDYRSIEGKAKPSREPAGSDLESASDSSNDGAAVNEDFIARNRNAALSRKVKDAPSDVNTWLELIDHQAAMVNPGHDLVDFTNAERRTLSDLRLSLFAKAIKVLPEVESERLTQLMLSEGATIWDRETLLQNTAEVLGHMPHSARLWSLYMDTLQSHSTNFRYEDTKAALLDTMKRLQMISKTLAKEHSIFDIGLHILLRVTSFIRDAGYTELSIAIWQAILHLHLKPLIHTAATTIEDSRSELEQWWDDEGPRFGEHGYQVGSGPSKDSDDHASENDNDFGLDSNAPFHSFAMTEVAQSTRHRYSGRTTDEDGIDDPFHVVFFSDIRPFIEASIPYNHESLINAYLHFFSLPNVPQPNGPSSSDLNWQTDVCLHNHDFQSLSPATIASLSRPTLNTAHSTTRTLFTPTSFPQTLSKPTITFLTHSLESLLALQCSPQLQEYYLAFILSYAPSIASKAARRLLKSQPQAIRLWNAAAVIEAKQDRHDKAEQIWEGALDLASKSQQEDGAAGLDSRVGLMVTIQCWTWSLLERGDREGALQRLGRLRGAASDGKFSTAARLGVQKVRDISHLFIGLHDEERVWCCKKLSIWVSKNCPAMCYAKSKSKCCATHSYAI